MICAQRQNVGDRDKSLTVCNNIWCQKTPVVLDDIRYNNHKNNRVHDHVVINTSASGRGVHKKEKLKTPNVERVKMCDH